MNWTNDSAAVFQFPIQYYEGEALLSSLLTIKRQENVLSHRGVASGPVDRDGDRRDEKVVAIRRRFRLFVPRRHRKLSLDPRRRGGLGEDTHRPGLGEGQADAQARLGRGRHLDDTPSGVA